MNHLALLHCFFVLTRSVLTDNKCASVSKMSSGRVDYYVTGMFPVYNTSPSRFNANGLQYIEIVRYVLMKANEQSSYRIGYVFYDTCGEEQLDITAGIFTDMLLDDFYVIQNEKNRVNKTHTKKKILKEKNTCRCQEDANEKHHIGIIGPASSAASQRASVLLADEHLVMISYAATSPVLSSKTDYPDFLRTIPSDTFQVQVIMDLILHFNWTYVSVISTDNVYGRAGQNHFRELAKAKGICLGAEVLFEMPYDEDELTKAVEILRQDEKAEVIVLFALSRPSLLLFKQAEKLGMHNKTWILSEAVTGAGTLLNKIEPSVLSGAIGITPYAGQYTEFEDYFWNLSYHDSMHNPFLKTFFNKRGINVSNSNGVTLNDYKSYFKLNKIGYTRNAITAFIVGLEKFVREKCGQNCSDFPHIGDRTEFNENYMKVVEFKGLMNETVKFDLNGDISTVTYFITNVQETDKGLTLNTIGKWKTDSGLVFTTNNIAWPKNGKAVSHCSALCSPGLYPLYHNDKPCCWDCVPCSKGLVKTGYGQGNCTRCPQNNMPYKERVCIKLKEAKPMLISTFLVVAFTLIGVLPYSFVLFTLVKHKHTLIVRTGNAKLSFIQVSLQSLLVLSFIIAVLDVNVHTCSLRIYIMGFLTVLIITIILIRTEVLLRIFNSNLRIDKTHVRITTTLQIAIAFATTSLFIFLQSFLYQFEPIKSKQIINMAEQTVVTVCHYNLHMVWTMLYLVLLSVMCGIQAFRARNLPDMYNEALLIMYAVFVSSLNFIIMALLSIYSRDEQNPIAFFLIIFFNNLAVLGILYGYKTWMIWLHRMKRTASIHAQNITSTFNGTMEFVQNSYHNFEESTI
ncbi:G-protein coupled receptor family C group 6 member A-like [Hydractinia symbiolongicarpus]|uniref:G-protein coupled receptor family C group 6 member A-like n=1 Tax=Hydractinia symbiolongicarpus TaxID=13093 RepID=UPI00254EE422|nr:G-protein coupled receptor family C group 6 member A-like [Hydractinia symbiolongicarpus]